MAAQFEPLSASIIIGRDMGMIDGKKTVKNQTISRISPNADATKLDTVITALDPLMGGSDTVSRKRNSVDVISHEE